MNFTLRLSVCLLMLTALPGVLPIAQGQEIESPLTDSVQTLDLLAQTPPAINITRPHPYLFIHSDASSDGSAFDRAAVLQRAQEYPWDKWYNHLKGVAGKSAQSLIDDKDSGLDYAAMMGTYYQLTKDRSLADKVRAKLNSVASILDEAGSVKGGHRAESFIPYIQCYDLIYDTASSSERDDYRKVIAAEADLWKNKLDSLFTDLDNMNFNNHEFKAAIAIAYAALAYPEHPNASGWLETGLKALRYAYYGRPNHVNAQGLPIRAFTPDGTFVEGNFYEIYTMDSLLPFLASYKKLTGINLLFDQAIYKSFEGLLRMRMPDGLLPSYADGNRKSFGMTMTAGDFGAIRGYMAHNALDESQFVYKQAHLNLAFYQQTLAPRSPGEIFGSPTQFFQKSGHVVFRKDWTPASSYMHLVGHQSPGISAHSQSDHASFTLYAHGTYLAIDPGYGSFEYNHTTNPWMTTSRAHNMVSVDGKGPNGVFRYFDPAILQPESFTQPGLDAATLKTWYRHSHAHFDSEENEWDDPWDNNPWDDPVLVTRTALFVKGMLGPNGNDYFIIIDQMDAAAEHDYDFSLHARGSLTIDNTKKLLTWVTPRDNGGTGNVELRVQLNATAPVAISRDENAYFETRNSDCVFCAGTHEYIQARARGTDAAYIALLYPRADGMTVPGLSALTGPFNAAGVKLTYSQNNQILEDTAYTKTVAGTTTVGQITSDAKSAFARSRDTRLTAVFLRDGKTFSYNGKPAFASGQTVQQAYFEIRDDRVTGKISCASTCDARLCDADGLRCTGISFPAGNTAIDLALAGPKFLRGNADGNDKVNLSDGIYLLSHLFLSGPGPSCYDAADATDDGTVNLSDAIMLLTHLFTGEDPLPAPGIDTPGADPTADALDCAQTP